MADTEDELREAAYEERRAIRRATVCVCGPELPGQCPGPLSCPYSGYGEDEDGEDGE